MLPHLSFQDRDFRPFQTEDYNTEAPGPQPCSGDGTEPGGFEPAYRKITDGARLDDSPYGVVHRIASDGTGKGTGAFCLSWAYNRCGHLRIDTHGDNAVMQRLLTKLGFVRCGTIYVEEDNDPRLAYEKSGKIMSAQTSGAAGD